MKLTMLLRFFFILIITFFSSCAVVRPGEGGVKQRLGKLKGEPKEQGIYLINPFTTKMLKVPTRTVNREVRLNLPSKEGLNVASEISILYHVEEGKAKEVINSVGKRFEQVMILSSFRSAAADVCARFYAKDMHSGKRGEIEKEIKKHMSSILQGRGFVIESILLKSITLPEGLYSAIESKLRAEQEAQQMDFVLQRERKEAERKRIEAEGVRDFQKIIKEGLTEQNIRWRSLEVLKELSSSNNAKIIITDGQTPVLINDKN